jgi:hypothetical protein
MANENTKSGWLYRVTKTFPSKASNETVHEARERRGELHAALCDLVAKHGVEDVCDLLRVASEDVAGRDLTIDRREREADEACAAELVAAAKRSAERSRPANVDEQIDLEERVRELAPFFAARGQRGATEVLEAALRLAAKGGA